MTIEEAIEKLRLFDFIGSNEDEEFLTALNMAIKALEQEPILEKIRAEIEQEYNRLSATRADETLELGGCLGLKMSLKVIDKYKAESEE